MPLPRNIDLTAHSDFGGNLDLDVISTIEVNDLLDRGYDDGPMTSEEYDAIAEHERIFGQRYHINRRRHIFARRYSSDKEWYDSEVSGTCVRCGRRIIPWAGELCPECNAAVEGRLPWNRRNEVSFGDRTMEVFSLR